MSVGNLSRDHISPAITPPLQISLEEADIADVFLKNSYNLSDGSCYIDLVRGVFNKKNDLKAVKTYLPQLVTKYKECDKLTLKLSTTYASIIKYALNSGFQFESANVETAVLSYNYAGPRLYLQLVEETGRHIEYLIEKGLGERAKSIEVKHFLAPQPSIETIDLSSFEMRTSIPQEVLDFDPTEKNTLITTDPDIDFNRTEDLQSILDVRLYPSLKKIILDYGLEIFLGTREEMAAYYGKKKSAILYEFCIPSSATYYLVESREGVLTVVMGGLVGRENMVAQLLTLKLAGIAVEKVEIIGQLDDFSRRVERDMSNLIQEIPEIKIGKQILIVAGCGLENFVNDMVVKEQGENLATSHVFSGDIVSLIYTPLKHSKNGIGGFITLHLTYGETIELIISRLLEETCCAYIFSGGACGYIRGEQSNEQVEIGSRISVTKSANEEGNTVQIGDEAASTHLQIPSIFLETYKWLESAKSRGSSVDVETFYILRAIVRNNIRNFYQVECDLGCFVSDFVGEKPLREYSKVFVNYQKVLQSFISRIFRKKQIYEYNPKLQTSHDVRIKNTFNDPRVPHLPMMEPCFFQIKLSEEYRITYRNKIKNLNPEQELGSMFQNKKWNLDYFLSKNKPVVLGKISGKEIFSTKKGGIGMRFLDMPIHMPGQGWRVPRELKQFEEILQMAIDYERVVDPDFEKVNYVYITIDQGYVEPGKAQRRVGWHGDSFLPIDTRNDKVDVTCDRVYVIGDCCPTPFIPGPFSFSGVNLKSWTEIGNHLTEVANQLKPDFYDSYTLLRLDPYCIHNVGFNAGSAPVFRTFAKISFSEQKYTHLGNAHNPLFIYDWAMTPRKEVPYSNKVLMQSAHRDDRDNFKEVNPYVIDFSKDKSNVSWTKNDIFTAFKLSKVNAIRVQKGEMLHSYDDNFLLSILSSEEGDWKVSTTQNVEYFLSTEKLYKFYEEDPERPGLFVSKPVERRMVEITEDVRFKAAWGTLVYAKKGDYLCFVDSFDVYTVPQSIYNSDFKRVEQINS